MDATTPNVVGPTMLGIVVSVCKFDRFQTLHNNSQQHVTGVQEDATMLGVVGRQCWVRLHGALQV